MGLTGPVHRPHLRPLGHAGAAGARRRHHERDAVVLHDLRRPTTPVWIVAVAQTVLSLGLALSFTPLFTASLASLQPKFYSYGSAVVGTVQQVAGAAGIALMFGVMAAAIGRRDVVRGRRGRRGCRGHACRVPDRRDPVAAAARRRLPDPQAGRSADGRPPPTDRGRAAPDQADAPPLDKGGGIRDSGCCARTRREGITMIVSTPAIDGAPAMSPTCTTATCAPTASSSRTPGRWR